MLDIFSLAVVIIRAVALLIISGAMSAIPAVWTAIKQTTTPTEGSDFTIPIVAGALSHLLLALLLLIYAKKIARFMTKGLENTNIEVNETNYGSVQAVAFSILGAYVLLYSIPTFIKIIAIEFVPNQSEGALFPTTNRTRVPVEVVVEQVVQVALGLWLVLGSKGIATSIRTFWKKKISADNTE